MTSLIIYPSLYLSSRVTNSLFFPTQPVSKFDQAIQKVCRVFHLSLERIQAKTQGLNPYIRNAVLVISGNVVSSCLILDMIFRLNGIRLFENRSMYKTICIVGLVIETCIIINLARKAIARTLPEEIRRHVEPRDYEEIEEISAPLGQQDQSETPENLGVVATETRLHQIAEKDPVLKEFVCPISMSPIRNVVYLKNNHNAIFDRTSVMDLLERAKALGTDAKCPVTRETFQEEDIHTHLLLQNIIDRRISKIEKRFTKEQLQTAI